MGMLLKPWTARTLKIHLGQGLFDLSGETWAPVLQATLVGLAFWLVCWWMFRRKIFIRV